MPNLLWWIPLLAGFQDGINPCVLMTAGCTLLLLLCFKTTGLSKSWLLFFLIPLILTAFVLNLGLCDKYILNKDFIQVVKIIYVLLSLLLMVYGVRFFDQWIKLSKGQHINEKILQIKKISKLLCAIVLILLGCFLSVLASLWPVNYYIAVAGVYLTMPEQMIPMGFIVFVYTLVSLWLVYFIFWLDMMAVKNIRLFKIVSAAILLSASLGVIDLFL